MTAFSIARALVWKSIRERKASIMLAPAGIGAFVILLGITAYFMPSLFTGTTRATLDAIVASKYQGVSTSKAMYMASVFGQGPFLIALLIALSASNTATALIGNEVRSGGFEVMLARVRSSSVVVSGLLFAVIGICLFDWLICLASVMFVNLVGTTVMDAWSIIPLQGMLASTLLPLPLAILGASTGAVIVLFWPSLGNYRIGTTGNLIQMIGSLPALILLIYSNFDRSYSGLSATILAWEVAGLALVLACVSLPHLLHREKLLANH